jgi:hypothetical protein
MSISAISAPQIVLSPPTSAVSSASNPSKVSAQPDPPNDGDADDASKVSSSPAAQSLNGVQTALSSLQLGG